MYDRFQSDMFYSLLSNDSNFKILNFKRGVYLVKSKTNERLNLWSYLVNFNSGTLRRIVSYDKKEHVVKFAYYCNQRQKIHKNKSYNYNNLSTYVKVFDHLEMYRKLVRIENNYKPKRPRELREESNYYYGRNPLRGI